MARKRRTSELPGMDELYDRLIAEQDGGCAICHRPPATRRLHIDHDHKTGKVRGLLCFTCNRFLCMGGVTPDRLRAAADYLERSDSTD